MSLAIALIWAYTVFWAVLPAFGFGSYGPEPFGTSCTINWYLSLLLVPITEFGRECSSVYMPKLVCVHN